MSDYFELEGTVVDTFPNAVFSVKLENEKMVTAHVSGKIRTNNIRILLGDKVTVAMSVYDLNQGRITFRHKK